MSHELNYGPSEFEQLSIQEQVEYVETHLEEIIADLYADETIPKWNCDLLADHYGRFRSQVEEGISWEEFEKELGEEFQQALKQA